MSCAGWFSFSRGPSIAISDRVALSQVLGEHGHRRKAAGTALARQRGSIDCRWPAPGPALRQDQKATDLASQVWFNYPAVMERTTIT